MSKKWKVLSSTDVFGTGYLKIRSQECLLPDGRIMPRYFVVDFPTWIHVVAIDEKQHMILVRQYRQAAQTEFLEVPGGALDPQSGESPLAAAQRELREETGYVSQNWQLISQNFPNPGLQSNLLYTFLAQKCQRVGEPELDPFEDLTVEFHKIEDIYKMLDQGKLGHSLVVSTLAIARPHIIS